MPSGIIGKDGGRWKLHVVCEQEIVVKSLGDKVAGVDLGICNAAAVALPDAALLYLGNSLKEDMHYFTRQEYKTEGENGPSNEARRLRETLARQKDHFLHSLSKDIVERCVEHSVGTLIIGDLQGVGVNEQDWGRHGNKRLHN